VSRIQEERSAETRRRLLDATVDCLFERGYAGTTTAEIASRAGLSKGAQLHHFPTKEKLVASALEYLFDLRLRASSDPEAIAALPKERKERLAAIVDMLVPVYESKIFYAWLELVVASRTDLALRSAVRRVSEQYSKEVLKIWKQLFGSPSDEASAFRMLDQVVNGQFATIALGSILNAESSKTESAESIQTIKDVGVFLLSRTNRSRRSAS
jgi:AcrR family transcriptional regulator